jgi:tetratricopeptide (TPR) repeat protein
LAIGVIVLALGFFVRGELWAESAREWNEKGINLTKQGQYQEALEAFRRAYREESDNPTIKANLATGNANYGWWLLSKTRPEEAVRAFDDAINIQDDVAKHYLGRGLANFRQNLLYEAIKDYERAQRLEPKNPVISQRLGEAYYQKGDLYRALNIWEEGLRNNPGNQALQNLVNNVRKEQPIEERFSEKQGYHFLLRYEGAQGGYDEEKQRHQLGEEVLGHLEEAYNFVGRELDYYPRDQIPVILYTNEQFKEIIHAPSWAGGRYDGKIRIPLKGLRPGSSFLKALLYHEYTHAVVHFLGGERVPAWLNEGLAQYMEGGSHQDKIRLVQQAKAKSALLPLVGLSQSFGQFSDRQRADLAYAQSLSAVQFFLERNSIFDLRKVISLLGRGSSIDEALKEVTRVNLADFENEWRRSL